ncbi:CHAT domain-containing protein [Sphingomonas sp. AP4-R1]|uniref:CHAT domain-containing protein n=1 Tax=Sphingomonas sp. AP4-R1 TaxID=2735134 RepID=UPI0014939E40|nr:CHAT domain-containing protein [Sphingomonas sp. AP4-R1]QJU57715.1 CHAT domain-containing protein [Sphingomonas sp. AP4-R1]
MIRSLACAALSLLALSPVTAATPRTGGIAVQDSFRIGSKGVLCTAQAQPLDPALKDMFDRGYGLVCRDATAQVGALFALRNAGADPLPALLAARHSGVTCATAEDAKIDGLAGARLTVCERPTDKLAYRAYAIQRGRTWYIAEGLGGYDSALRLALATLVTNRPVDGTVEVATTESGNPAAFARVQAGVLDPELALSQAYLRNNAGSFAEAAEFFQTLTERDGGGDDAARKAEYLANQGLQQSNLGNFAAADGFFAQAAAIGSTTDPVASRLIRNYRAMHALNQLEPNEAITALDVPVPPIEGQGNDGAIAGGVISPTLAEQINRQNAALDRLAGLDGKLRPAERATILDGQAQQLRGVAYRTLARYPEAIQSIEQGNRTFLSVREGRVASVAFLRSEGLAELALIAEARQDYGLAESHFAESAQILALDYPQSSAELAARARLAAFLARRGNPDRALPLYAQIVSDSLKLPGSAVAMRSLLAPYFALLAPRANSDPKAAEALFAANQVMVRPGVAQTQAVLARELSGGDDEAAALFRQSVSLSRDVARAAGEVTTVTAQAADGKASEAQVETARADLTRLEGEQTALQSRLAVYPRYRVLAPAEMTVADLQKALRAREAYYQLRIVDQDVYALMVTPGAVRAAKLPITADALGDEVASLRASVVTIENGKTVTYPFNVVLARKLYTELFDPFGADMADITSLIFEPDGPMLQLPPNLLVTEATGVVAYEKQAARPDGDPFDYRGIAWLGRDRDITTAVSPRSFVDVRAAAPARGKRTYLGLGHNAPLSPQQAYTRVAMQTGLDCQWPARAWDNPISASELGIADRALGAGSGMVITGAAFSDTALEARTDLADYRVIHFATHGLVTAPDPRCPARPALLTSFGDKGSDGLLSFREIFDLKLDADLVVLSACDTAGMATEEATREAGIATGGNFALDGLVRAFVGAGARSVVASHWPIPDDYGATTSLITALFTAKPGTPIAAAIRAGQTKLMAAAETSHPFYWSAFAVVGDGEKPVTPER